MLIEIGEVGLGLLGDVGSGVVTGTRSRVMRGGVEGAESAISAEDCGVAGVKVIGKMVGSGD